MAATVAERNAALLLMNLSAAEGCGGRGPGEGGEKRTEEKVGGLQAWTAVLDKAETGFDSCQDDRPAKKRRRTISI